MSKLSVSLQEKFQMSLPVKETDEAANKWVPLDGNPQKLPHIDKHRISAKGVEGKLNFLPPGMGISNVANGQVNDFAHTFGGDSDVSGHLVNDDALNKTGFTRLNMKGDDDQETGEHMDLFYGDVGGFAERNNYLDRE